MIADSIEPQIVKDGSTTSPNMGPALEKAELEIGEPLQSSLSSAPPGDSTNKEDNVGTATATGEHESDTIDANSKDVTKFNPGKRFYLAYSSLAVLVMMVALDGSSVSVALPARPPPPPGLRS